MTHDAEAQPLDTSRPNLMHLGRPEGGGCGCGGECECGGHGSGHEHEHGHGHAHGAGGHHSHEDLQARLDRLASSPEASA